MNWVWMRSYHILQGDWGSGGLLQGRATTAAKKKETVAGVRSCNVSVEYKYLEQNFLPHKTVFRTSFADELLETL